MSMIDKPKILIISHNAICEETNNGRTIGGLFASYGSEFLAQLFFKKENPEFKVCKNYYRITDFDIVNSIIKLKKPGKCLVIDEKVAVTANEKTIMQHGSKANPLTVFGRNMIWGLNTWWTKELKEWLKNFNPDLIFFYGSGYIFSEKVVLKISKYLKKPILTYWVDDYFINHQPYSCNLLQDCNIKSYINVTKKLMKKSDFIALSDFMRLAYEKTFNKLGYTLYTTSTMQPFKYKEKSVGAIIMSYLGNISIGRYKSLIDIAHCIEENDFPIELNVYTGEQRSWIIDNMRNIKKLNLKGKIQYSEVKEVMQNSNILVHVEDFEQQNINRVMYSLSTKIADALSSNRCLFAYGPENVASIDYLLKKDCAIVCTEKKTLKETLAKIAFNYEEVEQYAIKGIEVAKLYHNQEVNSEKILQIATSLVAKRSES